MPCRFCMQRQTLTHADCVLTLGHRFHWRRSTSPRYISAPSASHVSPRQPSSPAAANAASARQLTQLSPPPRGSILSGWPRRTCRNRNTCESAGDRRCATPHPAWRPCRGNSNSIETKSSSGPTGSCEFRRVGCWNSVARGRRGCHAAGVKRVECSPSRATLLVIPHGSGHVDVRPGDTLRAQPTHTREPQ